MFMYTVAMQLRVKLCTWGRRRGCCRHPPVAAAGLGHDGGVHGDEIRQQPPLPSIRAPLQHFPRQLALLQHLLARTWDHKVLSGVLCAMPVTRLAPTCKRGLANLTNGIH